MLQTIDNRVALKILESLRDDASEWNGFSYLNSPDPNKWERLLYKIIRLVSDWQSTYTNVVEFVKALSQNWKKTIPELLEDLDEYEINIAMFFQLERIVSYKLSSLLSDVNILYNAYRKEDVDISSFIYKISNAFLPRIVYQLEEFGLPRMISRKISNQNIIKLDGEEQDIYKILKKFDNIGYNKIIEQVNFSPIEEYILKFFYEGITFSKENPVKVVTNAQP